MSSELVWFCVNDNGHIAMPHTPHIAVPHNEGRAWALYRGRHGDLSIKIELAHVLNRLVTAKPYWAVTRGGYACAFVKLEAAKRWCEEQTIVYETEALLAT